ncbi:MAG: PAS domain-containing protein, partial [Alphaproteobacteria bacterium]|nr:PAS domain-containing protein [Alphaproteobacteria bacterium]
SALHAKSYLLLDFYSGATGQSGRFSEGFLLRRLHHDGQLDNGRWIRVIEKSIEGGGVISIYIDVTSERYRDEIQLRQTRLLRTILASMSEGLIAIDGGGIVIGSNRRYSELLDLPEGIVEVGTDIRRIIRQLAEVGEFGPISDVEAAVAERAAALLSPDAGGGVKSEERRRPNGQFLFIRRTEMPGGGAVAVLSDITELKRREAELAEKAMLLDAALESTGEGISVVGPDHRLVVGNRRFAELLDFPPSLIEPGTPFEEVIRYQAEQGEFGQGDVDVIVATRLDTLAARLNNVWERRRPNGRHIRFNRTSIPNGGFVTVYTDVTEARERESAFAEAADMSRAAFEGMDEGILVFNASGRLTLFNGRAQDILDPGERRLRVGMTVIDIATGGEDGVSLQAASPLFAALVDAAVGAMSEPQEREGDHGRIVEFRPYPMADGGTVVLVADRTVARQAEFERRRLELRLNQSEKMTAIGTLASGIAHDFNNILVPVLTLAEMAAEDAPQDSDLRRNMDSIAAAARRARDLIARLLAYAREDDGAVSADRIELCVVVREAAALLRASLPSSIELSVDLRQGEGCCDIAANSADIVKSVMNLATNSAHAIGSASGRIEISVAPLSSAVNITARTATLPPGAYAVLTVGDSGHGISSDVMARMFDPFFTTKGVGEGTGLGLSSVLGVVERLGGAIDVESTVGEGTTFRIYLPVAAAPELV